MADFLADKCDDLGFDDIKIDEVGNLIAKKGTGSPKIMLCGHMDVVPGKIKVRKEGDSLYGRGASDAKAPLIAMLFAAAAIQNNNGTVIFVAAVDEEGSATGIKNLVKKDMKTDYHGSLSDGAFDSPPADRDDRFPRRASQIVKPSCLPYRD